ncbi:carbonic anhydrase [Methanobacterium spitsbergense]
MIFRKKVKVSNEGHSTSFIFIIGHHNCLANS